MIISSEVGSFLRLLLTSLHIILTTNRIGNREQNKVSLYVLARIRSTVRLHILPAMYHNYIIPTEYTETRLVFPAAPTKYYILSYSTLSLYVSN